MSESLLNLLILVTALGSGLVAGVFFAFSAFVMTALGRMEPAQGIAAMQSINVAVLNPWFFTAFFGTGGLCLATALVALLDLGDPAAPWLLAGGALYLPGCILVTIAGNVPLNDRLGAVAPESPEGAELWRRYLVVWTNWNHLRTAASLAASACFILAL